MKNKKQGIALFLAGIIICCTACGSKPSTSNADMEKSIVENELSQGEPETADSVQKPEVQLETQESETQETVEEKPKEIELSNTYASKFDEVIEISEMPKFIFDYPVDWVMTQEEVSKERETAVISNERGVTVNFSYMINEGDMDGGDSHTTMLRVDISKITDTDFTTIYYDWGETGEIETDRMEKFMIAKLKVTGELDMMSDSDFTDVDGSVSYAVLPETRIGIDDAVRYPNIKLCAFDYLGLVSFWAESPDGKFTEQEEKEVLKILSSFRVDYDL